MGSGSGCDLRLQDPKVSRRHVHIRPGERGFEVKDLGSTNGTFLDGNLIDSVVVGPGTDIRIGDAVLRLLPAEDPLSIEPWPEERFGEMVGRSTAMREIFALLDRVSRSAAPVLLQGETGTGKDLVAKTLHAQSERAKNAFVAVDCAAIPESLIESELFGHVRGAFTGAVDARAGAFVRADGGTLFLDEIGELPLDLQPRFLRVLEERKVRAVGSDSPQPVDVRVVAATNRNLSALVDDGGFRADLYYRLAVVCLHLPPLRKRRDDIPLLAAELLSRLRDSDWGPIEGSNAHRLAEYAWPGNVRELRNVLERAVAISGEQQPGFAELALSFGSGPRKHLALEIDYTVPYAQARGQLIARFEETYMRGLLTLSRGNVAEAARVSGLSRKSIYELLKRHGLRS